MMLIINVGMQKAGSSWHCNMVGELAVRAGHEATRDLRDRLGLRDVLGPWHTPGIGRMWGHKLRRIERVVGEEVGPDALVVFKTHEAPWPTARRLLREGRARATYVYRDPRDVVISAFRHGERERAEGRGGRFALRGFGRFMTIEQTARWVRRRLLPIWGRWTSLPGVLGIQYEELNINPLPPMLRTRDHLGIGVPDDVVAEVVEQFKPEALKSNVVRGALHLDGAVVGRHKEMLTSEQIDYCNRLFEPWLERMGYAERQ